MPRRYALLFTVLVSLVAAYGYVYDLPEAFFMVFALPVTMWGLIRPSP